MSESEDNSLPLLPDEESRGSSVSSTLRREYEDLLKFAVVTPKVYVPTPVYETKAANTNQDQSTTTADSSNAYTEEITVDSVEDVRGLPATPVAIHVTGTLARDTLLTGADITPTSEDLQPGESENSPPSGRSDRSEASSPTVDVDLARMEHFLDQWCGDLKRGVLTEYAQSKMGMLQKQKEYLKNAKEEHNAEMNKLVTEVENMKELLYTYEQTVKHKDSIIINLTNGIQKQKDRCEMMKAMNKWKLRHSDEKRESFSSKLAQKHRKQVMKAKVWAAWHGVVESRWRDRVEKACQSKSQEVCVKLTENYEKKIEEMNKALEAAQSEIARLHAQRDQYEETMKKAFMRGVCALNMEAMSMFRESPDQHIADGPCQDSAPSTSQAFPPIVPFCQDQIRPSDSHADNNKGKQTGKTTITVKTVGKIDVHGTKSMTSGSGSVQGTVNTVKVQRHYPGEPSSAPPPQQGGTRPTCRTSRPGNVNNQAMHTVHSATVKVVR